MTQWGGGAADARAGAAYAGAADPIGAGPNGAGPSGAGPSGAGPSGAGPSGGAEPTGSAGRHPADPEPVTSSKAVAVLALGIIGMALMLCGGGLVPGVVGVVLVRSTRAEISAAGGFLTGSRPLRVGEVLSWIALCVSAIVIALVVVGLLIGSVGGDGPQYGNDVN